VPVAGNSYWSSKRRHASATDLEILRPIGKKNKNQFRTHLEPLPAMSEAYIFMSYQ
jgi:hypothetical protein